MSTAWVDALPKPPGHHLFGLRSTLVARLRLAAAAVVVVAHKNPGYALGRGQRWCVNDKLVSLFVKVSRRFQAPQVRAVAHLLTKSINWSNSTSTVG